MEGQGTPDQSQAGPGELPRDTSLSIIHGRAASLRNAVRTHMVTWSRTYSQRELFSAAGSIARSARSGPRRNEKSATREAGRPRECLSLGRAPQARKM